MSLCIPDTSTIVCNPTNPLETSKTNALTQTIELIRLSPELSFTIDVSGKGHSSYLVCMFLSSLYDLLSYTGSNLAELTLKNFVFDYTQFKTLIKCLCLINTSVISLNISNFVLYSSLGAQTNYQSFDIIGNIIRCNKTLTSLTWLNTFPSDTIVDETNEIVLALCIANTTLQYLNLSNLTFTYSSIAAILDQNSTLQSLSVRNTDTWDNLSESLLSTDESSDLSDTENDFESEDPFQTFCYSLANNTSLTELNLNGSSIDQEEPLFLIALQTNITLRCLSFNFTPYPPGLVIFDSIFFASLSNLVDLKISSGSPQRCRPADFCTFLNTNTSLTSLSIPLKFIPDTYIFGNVLYDSEPITCPDIVYNTFDRSPTMHYLNLKTECGTLNPDNLSKINKKKAHNQKMKNLLLIDFLLEIIPPFKFGKTLSA